MAQSRVCVSGVINHMSIPVSKPSPEHFLVISFKTYTSNFLAMILTSIQFSHALHCGHYGAQCKC